jgi:Na+/H+ antiporter NhaA
MALFISGLSMPNQMKLDESKIAILFASILAGLAGFMWLYFSSKPQAVQEAN